MDIQSTLRITALSTVYAVPLAVFRIYGDDVCDTARVLLSTFKHELINIRIATATEPQFMLACSESMQSSRRYLEL